VRFVWLQAQYESLLEGGIIGPELVDNSYQMYKVSEIFEDTVYYARASHILIRWIDETDQAKLEARQNAQDIFKPDPQWIGLW